MHNETFVHILKRSNGNGLRIPYGIYLIKGTTTQNKNHKYERSENEKKPGIQHEFFGFVPGGLLLT